MGIDISAVIDEKLRRFSRGGPPRVLDLFAGCGGFSLGFEREGFELVGAIEKDEEAIATHGRNFFPGRQSHLVARDITSPESEPERVLEDFGYDDVSSAVDVLIGGPPCQAYTRIGRAKLSTLNGGDKSAHINDQRAYLYKHFLRFVEATVPLVVLIENVYDITSFGGRNLADEICVLLAEMGYAANYAPLNSANFGVPQYRERIFILATHLRLDVAPKFPEPTHGAVMPQGYTHIRAAINGNVRLNSKHAVKSPSAPIVGIPPAVTTGEALRGLPGFDPLKHLSKSYRPKESAVAYLTPDPTSDYDRIMRHWPGRHSLSVRNHATRSLFRDAETFRRMKPGDEYPEAFAIAFAIWQERSSGLSREEAEILRKSIVPPYALDKFPNRWRKLDPNQPSRTLTAHLGKDCYSHIHFDSAQGRTITVREAARLQSFPDEFFFECGLNSSFRQIGNAVPPLMSASLASAVKELLRGANHSASERVRGGVAAL